MSNLWVVLPPWLYAAAITLFGRWGQKQWIDNSRTTGAAEIPPVRHEWGKVLVTTLVFYSLLPATVLPAVSVFLPFTGARAGLSLGLTAFLFGCLPVRILGVSAVGWDSTLWHIFVDLLRLGGALAIAGSLVVQ